MLIFLVRRFHEPIQFLSWLSVLFHLPIPIVLFGRIEKSGQFTALFWRELVDSCFNFFDTTHVKSLSADGEWDKSALVGYSDFKNIRQPALRSPHLLKGDGQDARARSWFGVSPVELHLARLAIIFFLTRARSLHGRSDASASESCAGNTTAYLQAD